MVKDQIIQAIKTAAGVADVALEFPENEAFGDYSSNIALIEAKAQGINPQKLAEDIAKKINAGSGLPAEASAKAGFINFWLAESILVGELEKIHKEKEKFLGAGSLEGEKISVEYTDPNPFKEFHIGHLYSNVIGESIARILEAEGATVWRADFYGDTGMHIAKSVWGMMQKMEAEKLTLTDLTKLSLKERQAYMGQGYALGVNKYDEDEAVKKEVDEINYMIYEDSQKLLVENKAWTPVIKYEKRDWDEKKFEKVGQVYAAGLSWSLQYFETYYKRLGTKFDGYYPESWMGEYGVGIVEKGIKKGVLEKGEEGAIIFPGEKYGLHTRVFMNKFGLPTYEAKDLGLAWAKYKDFKYDRSINVFGKEIDEYYKVVREAMRLIEPELGKKAEYVAHGMVNLPEGKMSSRTGNVITVEWLIDEAGRRLQKLHPMPAVLTEQVAQGAIKYAFLKNGIGGNITFDFDESISFEGNSGPYLQYTVARCNSVLVKSANPQIGKSTNESLNDKLNNEELSVLRSLIKFPEVVGMAAKFLAPNLLCNYLFDLAQKYNTFYNKHSILTNSDQLTTDFRLALTSGVGQVLKNGLKLLGIQAPERM
jgi:arginyl-tRNA synthetase